MYQLKIAYCICGIFGSDFNLAILASITNYNVCQHCINHMYYEAMYT